VLSDILCLGSVLRQSHYPMRVTTPRWTIAIIADEELIYQGTCGQTFNKTLQHCIALLEPLPQAELIIRSAGVMRGWMHTNHRGEIDAIEVFSPVSSTVIAMNPQATCLNSNTSEKK